MSELRVIGHIDGDDRYDARLTVSVLDDWRTGGAVLPRAVYRFSKAAGSGWTALGGGEATLPAPTNGTAPRVRVTYTLLSPLPFARTVVRRLMPNTEAAGLWDFTRPDAEQPRWDGGEGMPTPVKVLPGTGPQGDAGLGWHAGIGAPSASLGRDGELYLNTATGEVYQRTAGVWVLKLSLAGTQGVPGPKGERGPKGESWPAPLETDVGGVLRATEAGAADWRRLALADLSDVSAVPPADGQVLRFSAATGKYIPTPPPPPPAPPPLVPLGLPLPFPAEGVVVSGLEAYTLEAVVGPHDKLEITPDSGTTWQRWWDTLPQPMPNMLRVQRSEEGGGITTLLLRTGAAEG